MTIGAQAQEFKDKIITIKNDTITCQITMINDDNIFFNIINRGNNHTSKYLSLVEIKSYYATKDSKPEILTSIKPDSTGKANMPKSIQFKEIKKDTLPHISERLNQSLQYQYDAGLYLKKSVDNSIAASVIGLISSGVAIALFSSGEPEAGYVFMGIGGVFSIGLSISAIINRYKASNSLMKNQTLIK